VRWGDLMAPGYVASDDYQGPDRRARERGVAAAVRSAYDVGSIFRGAVQIIVVLAAGLWAWNSLENTVANSRDRIVALEAVSRERTTLLVQLPLLSQTVESLKKSTEELGSKLAVTDDLSKALATLTERIEWLRATVARLDQSLSRQERQEPGGQ
jgi:hypothetical protein